MNQKATLIAAAVCSFIAFMMGQISSTSDEASDPSNNAPGPRARSATRDSFDAKSQSGSGLSASEATARMKAIIDHPSRLERVKQWLRFVKRLGPDEFKEAVANFRASNLSRYQPTEYSMLLSAWAKVDPIVALEYAKKNTDGSFASQTILTSWALKDPEAAMKWVELNCKREKDPSQWHAEYAEGMVAVIRGIAASDPARATALLESNPGLVKVVRYVGYENEALLALQGEYLKQGPDAAREWAMSFRDEELRTRAVEGITEKLARNLNPN